VGTRACLDAVPKQTSATNAQLMAIMMLGLKIK
jgi:chemotaxis regulatin CheY-phosphate phosphatase CheZ